MLELLQRVRLLIWRAAPVLLGIGAALIIGLLVWYFLVKPENSSSKPTVPTPSSASQSDDQQTLGAADFVSEKPAIKTAVEDCLKQYYFRDAALLAGSEQEAASRLRRNLKPYVTDGFLESYVSPPLSAPVDYAFRDAGGVQKVASVTFTGDGDPSSGIETDISLTVSLRGVETSVTKRYVTLTLEKYGSTWRVSSLIEE